MQAGDYARGILAAEYGIGHLSSAKEDPDHRSFLDKIISLFYLFRAVLLEKKGQTEQAQEDLRKAVRIAKAFDSAPVYTLENMVFMEHMPKTIYMYDDAGPTAVDGLRATLDEAGDLVPESFRKKFEKEIV